MMKARRKTVSYGSYKSNIQQKKFSLNKSLFMRLLARVNIYSGTPSIAKLEDEPC